MLQDLANRLHRLRTSICGWAAVVFLLMPAWVNGQTPNAPAPGASSGPATRPAASPDLGESDSATGEDWLSRLAGLATAKGATHAYSRNHLSVLAAFREVVQTPSRSTVRVIGDDKQLALGMIVDADGFIATKGSELQGELQCELSDGTRLPATLVGIDRGSDLALLRVAAGDLPVARWRQSSPPAVGGWVVSVGTQELPQAIGVVSVAPHRVRGGVLGIQMTEDNPGPRVTFVVPDSGAAQAGVRSGDVITHANGQPVKTAEDMVTTTSLLLPGDEVRLQIRRARQEQEIVATLGSVADTLSSQRARFQDALGGPLSQRRFLFPSALEHDSVLLPNECGGPLIDLDGNVIGINIARASRISSYAIPADVALPVLERLKEAALIPVSSDAASNSVSAASTDAPR